ncbi:hypothetical protein AURDEDRAFT_110019 [Auricularia subglabra TFB-10046 SS5]|nr:hypothetical protein AURDEDRAFT_110019 [Auricularia subglabra TFB-10046 SS5]
MPNQAAPNPRKRTLTLANGEDVDLTKDVVPSAEVVAAMKQRILQLEDQLAAATASTVKEPPAKRQRTSTAATAATDAPVASGSSAKEASKDEKKRKMQLKKIFDRVKKECKSDTCKFQGAPKSIKVDEVLEVAEFDAMFSGQGTLIQPTPTNKPKSTVTIIHFNEAQARDFFGDSYSELKGNSWSRGGGPSFAKSTKLAAVPVEIDSMQVEYSKNTMKCTFKLDVSQSGGVRGGMLGVSQRRSFGRMGFLW